MHVLLAELPPVGARLPAVDLHPGREWDHTIAMGSVGGAFAGCGQRKARKGERAVDAALLWRPDRTRIVARPEGLQAPAANTRGRAARAEARERKDDLRAGERAGSKLEKARALGVLILTEAEFRALCQRIPITEEMKRRYLG